MMPGREVDIDWEATTWEGNRRRQLEHWAQLSLDEIFAAQEEMAEFARQVGSVGPDCGARDCVGPDGSCLCGSGKKYKQCHGKGA
jgi:uncharacterized protein YchJ